MSVPAVVGWPEVRTELRTCVETFSSGRRRPWVRRGQEQGCNDNDNNNDKNNDGNNNDNNNDNNDNYRLLSPQLETLE